MSPIQMVTFLGMICKKVNIYFTDIKGIMIKTIGNNKMRNKI